MKRKRIFRSLAVIMALGMAFTSLTGCASNNTTTSTPAPSSTPAPAVTAADADANQPVDDVEASGVSVINLWSFTDEVPGKVEEFKAKYNPDYEINVTIIATDNGAYTSALDAALAGGGADAPDVFATEGAFMKKYAAGDMKDFTMPLVELGLDVIGEAEKAGIAPYIMDAASDEQGRVKGLAFQATGGAFLYRRSIANEYLGSDDPAHVYNYIKDWDTFTETARMLKEQSNGEVVMVSGDGDIWHPMENSRNGQWIQDGRLVIEDNVLEYFELARIFKQEGLMNGTTDWDESWFADMSDNGMAKVFGWFGPAWFINYVLINNVGDTFGDWAVCEPTVPFYWGGTWLMANANTQAKKEVADFIHFFTLDIEPDGLMANWVKTGDTVASSVLMDNATAELDLMSGQNVFEVFVPANQTVDVKSMGLYDETINNLLREEVAAYAEGSKDLETALRDFKDNVANVIDVIVD